MPRFMNHDPLILPLRPTERGGEFIVFIEAAAVVGGAHLNVGSGLRLGERDRKLRVAFLGRISFRHYEVPSCVARAFARVYTSARRLVCAGFDPTFCQ